MRTENILERFRSNNYQMWKIDQIKTRRNEQVVRTRDVEGIKNIL